MNDLPGRVLMVQSGTGAPIFDRARAAVSSNELFLAWDDKLAALVVVQLAVVQPRRAFRYLLRQGAKGLVSGWQEFSPEELA